MFEFTELEQEPKPPDFYNSGSNQKELVTNLL